MANPVRGKPLCTSDFGGLFYNAAHLALIDAPSPAANKDRFSFSRGDFSTAFVNPLLYGVFRCVPERHYTLLIALTGVVQGTALKINIP